MDLKQAKITLEKINRLYESMALDKKNIDVFEQDLMLSYIRQMYISFSPKEEASVIEKGPSRRKVAPLPKVKEEPKAIKVIRKEPVKPKATPPPVPVVQEVEEVIEVVQPEPVKVTAPPVPKVEVPKVEVPKVEEIEVPVVEIAKPKVAKVSTHVPVGGDSEELFDQKEATDLSEKLSQMPIKDLTKAMGLNEKIFTIKELFGGDNSAYDETMKALNGLSNFDEAKTYLMNNIAGKFDWATKEKKKKAKKFIKLIRRRYN